MWNSCNVVEDSSGIWQEKKKGKNLTFSTVFQSWCICIIEKMWLHVSQRIEIKATVKQEWSEEQREGRRMQKKRNINTVESCREWQSLKTATVKKKESSSKWWKIITKTKFHSRKITHHILRALTQVISVYPNKCTSYNESNIPCFQKRPRMLFHCHQMLYSLQTNRAGFPSVYNQLPPQFPWLYKSHMSMNDRWMDTD